jgi:hypothetical protein
MLHLTLNIHLAVFAIGRRGQRYLAEDPRTYAFRDGADRAALSCSVVSFEHDYHSKTFELDPVLKFAELGLEASQFFFVWLAFETAIVCALSQGHEGLLLDDAA